MGKREGKGVKERGPVNREREREKERERGQGRMREGVEERG